MYVVTRKRLKLCITRILICMYWYWEDKINDVLQMAASCPKGKGESGAMQASLNASSVI